MSFDLKAFLSRKNLKHRELADILGCSVGFIGMMASGKSGPSYDTIVKLIENGITLYELFGNKLAEDLVNNSSVVPQNPSKEEVMDSVRAALSEMLGLGKNF